MQARWNGLGLALVVCGFPAVTSAQSLQDAVGQVVKGAAETDGKVGEAAVNTAAKVVSSPSVQNAATAEAQAAILAAQSAVDAVGSIASNRDVARLALGGTQGLSSSSAASQPVRARQYEHGTATNPALVAPGSLLSG